MALILIDHSGCDAKPHTEWGRHEYEACLCEHCETMIAFIKRGCNEFAVSCGDMRQQAFTAHEQPSGYVHKYKCRYCGKNICKDCFAALEKADRCPGPFKEQLRKVAEGRLSADAVFCRKAVRLGC